MPIEPAEGAKQSRRRGRKLNVAPTSVVVAGEVPAASHVCLFCCGGNEHVWTLRCPLSTSPLTHQLKTNMAQVSLTNILIHKTNPPRKPPNPSPRAMPRSSTAPISLPWPCTQPSSFCTGSLIARDLSNPTYAWHVRLLPSNSISSGWVARDITPPMVRFELRARTWELLA